MALRGFRKALRAQPRGGGLRLLEALRSTKEEGPSFIIEASLCVNELSKRPKEFDTETWEEIAHYCTPLMSKMPAQNLTLTVNALAHARVSNWTSAAEEALMEVREGGFSAQDLCLTLSAMSRLSWAPPALLARVLRDVRGRARRDLEPRGAAALAHAVAQLGEHTELVAEVVQELVPTLRRFARKGFKPAEVALSLDALSRMGGESHGSSTGSFPLPRWAEEAMAALEEDLARVAQHLRYPELVMVLVASARRSGGLSGGVGGVGEELMKAIEATFSNCPTAELCIMVHCMARLQLNFAMSQDLALVILDHLCPQKNPGLRTDCSLDHVILLLHAFAKLSVRPSQPYWALVSQRLRDAALVSRSNAVRLCLAAAKLDHRGVAIGHLARADGDGHVYGVALDGLLANLCDEAFASMVFALLHPFYFNQRHLQELLVYAAAREICAQSLALQVRIGLVALVYLGSSTFPLQVAQSLTRLEKATAQRAVWQLPAQASPLQQDPTRYRSKCPGLASGSWINVDRKDIE
ncbi:Uncharacterized protein SCF082_LOCUS49992 [Durusdinium trenchii]|uniref:Uncharacterized protein n=1 Tax=Durusdinium trenchii TaxID=1381693 RepID=A0ABP0S4Z8_9DINO